MQEAGGKTGGRRPVRKRASQGEICVSLVPPSETIQREEKNKNSNNLVLRSKSAQHPVK